MGRVGADGEALGGLGARDAAVDPGEGVGEVVFVEAEMVRGVVAPVQAPDPREDGHVGDAVAVVDHPVAPLQPLLDHAQQPLHLVAVPLRRVRVVALVPRVFPEMPELYIHSAHIQSIRHFIHSPGRRLVESIKDNSSTDLN